MSFSVDASKSIEELLEIYKQFKANDHEKLERIYAEYSDLMKKMHEKQDELKKIMDYNLKKLSCMKDKMMRFKAQSKSAADRSIADECYRDITKLKENYEEHALGLPKKPSWFLSKCIGEMDVSLYCKKYNYKEAYENLKMNATILSLVFWAINFFILPYRIFDCLFNAFVLWYFSSLTLQEHILAANGSRIMLWWRFHHYISIFGSGIVMVWPDCTSYQIYRPYYYIYTLLQALVHILQYSYQKRILYRLKTLGLSSSMTLTVDGFRSFMWNGFTFLMGILMILYAFQLYSSYILFNIYKKEEKLYIFPLILSIIFFVVFLGNLVSAIGIIIQKTRQLVLKTRSTCIEYQD